RLFMDYKKATMHLSRLKSGLIAATFAVMATQAQAEEPAKLEISNPYQQRLCDPQFNKGSLFENWLGTFTHYHHVENDERAGRGLAYGRFADVFWKSMDAQAEADKPKTVRDMLNMV